MVYTLHLVGVIAAWVALAGSVAFCSLYALVAPWRSSAEGRHLMVFTAVLSVAFGWWATRQTFAHQAVNGLDVELPKAVIISTLATMLWWRLGLLIRAQVATFEEETEDMSGPPMDIGPIPPPTPSGATDAGLGGIDVTDEYLTPDGELRFALPPIGSWAAVFAYARSFLGDYPPGRVRENVNAFTKEYYGDDTKAAWCLIFVWHVLSHFGLAGWKLAYVPWLGHIDGEHDGHAGIKLGAITAIAGYSHVGFNVGDHGETFDLLSGNSTSGASSDAITVKRYGKSVIAGYVNVAYTKRADPAVNDGTAMVVSVGA